MWDLRASIHIWIGLQTSQALCLKERAFSLVVAQAINPRTQKAEAEVSL